MATAGLRIAKAGPATIGGIRPSKRSPVSGKSAETAANQDAPRRRRGGRRDALFARRQLPTIAFRCQQGRRPGDRSTGGPSGLSMTSTTAGSSRQVAIAGPIAVRSMRTLREAASDLGEIVPTLAPFTADRSARSNVGDGKKGPDRAKRNNKNRSVGLQRRMTGKRDGCRAGTGARSAQITAAAGKTARQQHVRSARHFAGARDRQRFPRCVAYRWCRCCWSQDLHRHVP
jgi:hypothetical protein